MEIALSPSLRQQAALTVAVTSLRFFQGPSLYPTSNALTSVPFHSAVLRQDPLQDIFPLVGPGSFPLPRFLASAFIFHLPAISLLCLLSSYFFAFLFFYYLPIFILLLLHFSLFPVISHRPFFGPLYTTQSHLLRSLFTSVYYRDTTFAPSQFQFYLLFRCSILLISFLFFSCLSIHIIMFLLSPDSARGNFTMEQSWTTPFTPSYCFVSHFSIIIYGTDFYGFFCSGLLISIFFQFVPVIYSTFVFWCLPALHVVSLKWSSAGLQLLPSLIFMFWIYLFINHILHYLSSSFLPLCSCRRSSTLFPI